MQFLIPQETSACVILPRAQNDHCKQPFKLILKKNQWTSLLRGQDYRCTSEFNLALNGRFHQVSGSMNQQLNVHYDLSAFCEAIFCKCKQSSIGSLFVNSELLWNRGRCTYFQPPCLLFEPRKTKNEHFQVHVTTIHLPALEASIYWAPTTHQEPGSPVRTSFIPVVTQTAREHVLSPRALTKGTR